MCVIIKIPYLRFALQCWVRDTSDDQHIRDIEDRPYDIQCTPASAVLAKVAFTR